MLCLVTTASVLLVVKRLNKTTHTHTHIHTSCVPVVRAPEPRWAEWCQAGCLPVWRSWRRPGPVWILKKRSGCFSGWPPTPCATSTCRLRYKTKSLLTTNYNKPGVAFVCSVFSAVSIRCVWGTFSCSEHGGGQLTLLGLQVSQCEPARVSAGDDGDTVMRVTHVPGARWRLQHGQSDRNIQVKVKSKQQISLNKLKPFFKMKVWYKQGSVITFLVSEKVAVSFLFIILTF